MNVKEAVAKHCPDVVDLANKAVEAHGKLLFLAVGGSYAYGTATKNSDVDIRGVYLNSLSEYYGLNWSDEITIPGVKDSKLFSAKKFVQLALKGNPNILELLSMPQDCVLVTSLGFDHFHQHRNDLISKAVANPYIGFVTSQLRRMTHFDQDKTQPEGNRAVLIHKYGYDTKNVMHAIRLCRNGVELLSRGFMDVRRPDYEYLLEVLNGKYGVKEAGNAITVELAKLRAAEARSTLQDTPNRAVFNILLQRVVEGTWNEYWQTVVPSGR